MNTRLQDKTSVAMSLIQKTMGKNAKGGNNEDGKGGTKQLTLAEAT